MDITHHVLNVFEKCSLKLNRFSMDGTIAALHERVWFELTRLFMKGLEWTIVFLHERLVLSLLFIFIFFINICLGVYGRNYCLIAYFPIKIEKEWEEDLILQIKDVKRHSRASSGFKSKLKRQWVQEVVPFNLSFIFYLLIHAAMI